MYSLWCKKSFSGPILSKMCKNIDFKRNNAPPNDKPIIETPKGLSAGEGVVICLFSPIAGAIGYLLWHDEKPKKANESCVIAIVAFVVLFFVYVVGSLIYRAYFSDPPIDTTSDINSVRGSVGILLTMIG